MLKVDYQGSPSKIRVVQSTTAQGGRVASTVYFQIDSNIDFDFLAAKCGLNYTTEFEFCVLRFDKASETFDFLFPPFV